MALQIAAADGATLTAQAAHGDGLAQLGATRVTASLEGLGPFDAVLDLVGGPQMVDAWSKLAPGGVLLSVGWASGEPAVFPPRSTIGPAKSLVSFIAGDAFRDDLEELLRRVALSALTVDLAWAGPWEDLESAISVLDDRTVHGRVILDVTGDVRSQDHAT
jgi:NADPH:quinone reductase-like Zn-dependent oxidoreductase